MSPFLLFTAGSRICALPVGHVSETPRPLPVRPAPSDVETFVCEPIAFGQYRDTIVRLGRHWLDTNGVTA